MLQLRQLCGEIFRSNHHITAKTFTRRLLSLFYTPWYIWLCKSVVVLSFSHLISLNFSELSMVVSFFLYSRQLAYFVTLLPLATVPADLIAPAMLPTLPCSYVTTTALGNGCHRRPVLKQHGCECPCASHKSTHACGPMPPLHCQPSTTGPNPILSPTGTIYRKPSWLAMNNRCGEKKKDLSMNTFMKNILHNYSLVINCIEVITFGS